MARFQQQEWSLWGGAGLPVLDTAPANQPQGMAEPLSQAGGVSVKACLRKGRKHQRGRGENKSGSKEEVLHGRTGTLWMDMTVGLMLEHRTRVSRKEGQRDTRSRPQAMPHWRDWGYPAAVTRVEGEVLGAKLNLRRREDRCFNCSTSLFVHFPTPESVIKCLCSRTTNTIKFPKSGLFCLQGYLVSGFPVFILTHEFSCSQSLFSPHVSRVGWMSSSMECLAGTWGQPATKNCS